MTAASVLVCTRDRPDLLAGCVHALAGSLRDGDELVVVEAGDSDASGAVEALGHPSVVVAAQPLGKSHQLNLGLRVARHDVVVMTDDDCRTAPGWVDAMARPFADPRVGVVFGPVGGLSSLPGAPPRVVPAGPAPYCTWDYAHGAAMAVRRAAALEAGGFDERLGPGTPLHGEEHDLLLRLLERGWEAEIADAPMVEHVEWRDAEATSANLLVYERGAGAFLGAAVRRAPRRWTRLAALRARHEVQLLRTRPAGGRYAVRLAGAFAAGFGRGLLLAPRRRSAP